GAGVTADPLVVQGQRRVEVDLVPPAPVGRGLGLAAERVALGLLGFAEADVRKGVVGRGHGVVSLSEGHNVMVRDCGYLSKTSSEFSMPGAGSSAACRRSGRARRYATAAARSFSAGGRL